MNSEKLLINNPHFYSANHNEAINLITDERHLLISSEEESIGIEKVGGMEICGSKMFFLKKNGGKVVRMGVLDLVKKDLSNIDLSQEDFYFNDPVIAATNDGKTIIIHDTFREAEATGALQIDMQEKRDFITKLQITDLIGTKNISMLQSQNFVYQKDQIWSKVRIPDGESEELAESDQVKISPNGKQIAVRLKKDSKVQYFTYKMGKPADKIYINSELL